MSETPKTLLELAGAPTHPGSFADAALLLIDYQKEYTDGNLQLQSVSAAIAEAAILLNMARKAGAPVFHIVHHGRPGAALFNPESAMVEIVPELLPNPGETVVTKGLPNAFARTNLQELLQATGCKELIVSGFMSHLCVSSTVRAALDLGYRSTIIASACATRPLPIDDNDSVPATDLHRAELAALGDRFAVICRSVADLPSVA